MPTTTFNDVKMTEDLEHRYEKTQYELSEGDVVRMPRHTASKMVNKWDVAEWTDTDAYEVNDREYDEAVMSTRNDEDVCEVETGDGEVCGREKPCQYHDE